MIDAIFVLMFLIACIGPFLYCDYEDSKNERQAKASRINRGFTTNKKRKRGVDSETAKLALDRICNGK